MDDNTVCSSVCVSGENISVELIYIMWSNVLIQLLVASDLTEFHSCANVTLL